MKIKPIAQACMWLPGFAPDEDPLVVLGSLSASTVEEPETPPSIQPLASWPKLDETHHASVTTPVPKYEANINAIKLLRKLESEGRSANADEHAILSLYTGWGGLVKALDEKTPDAAWRARHDELKDLLTKEEFDSAVQSSLNAYFTPIAVVKAMWDAVRRLGFKGGNVLEPSCGAGYFLGAMPEDLASKSRLTAIELDNVSARMTKAMYAQYGVNVIESAFERARIPEEGYDLVIGNPPFGAERSAELRNVPFATFTLHNYFIAKALECVRPGGLVVFLTSTGTLDSTSEGHREYINRVAKLVGAIRLPSNTFKEIAETSVTTDLLIFQKREAKAVGAQESKWIDCVGLPSSSPINGELWTRMHVNEYYVNHPTGVIGKLKASTQKHGLSVICKFEGDVAAALNERVGALPEGIYEPRKHGHLKAKVDETTVKLDGWRRPGLALIDGKLMEVDGDVAKPVAKTGKTLLRMVSLVQVRDALRTLIAAQSANAGDRQLDALRLALNVAYDNHVEAYGYLNASENKRAFSTDPDVPLLISIENWNAQTQTASKAPIFTTNTVAPAKLLERCESVGEALQASLAETGCVVPHRIAQLMDMPEDDVMSELENSGRVFLDPETMEWEAADSYLSGHVRRKLEVAQISGERFRANAKALEAAMPTQLRPGEIQARLGSTWIPTQVYDQFLDETFEYPHGKNKVEFDARVGSWSVSATHVLTHGVAATQTYGTKRVNAAELLEMELNQRKPTVYDQIDRTTRVVNPRETVLAREKQNRLKEAFAEWLWKDGERAEMLAKQYNLQFRSTRARRFDGSHLVLPGLSSVYTLRSHQRDAVWRVVSSSYNTLLAHAVGAGKTLEMICAGMELRRLGLAKKVMFVVPNHMLLDFANAFMKAYPSAKVLAASKDDLAGAKRKLMLSRIATHDWDAVIVTHATFESIKVSDSYMRSYIEDEIDSIASALRERKSYEKGSIVKELARAKKQWTNKLDKLSKQSVKDDMLTFEELGVDYLAYDESHTAKNLWRFSKMDRVAGLPNSNSQIAFDVFVKTQYIRQKRGDGKGVIFATATPLSNSMAEMYTCMRFLQEDLLWEYGVGHFDAWAANFGETVTAMELAPDGSGYRMQNRFSRFVNVPELMNMFRQVADIRTPETLDLPVPKAVSETISVEPSEELRAYVQDLVERAADIRSGGVKPKEDNMLKVTSDGRKAALDVRLVGLPAPVDKSGKLYVCARNVHRIWAEYADSKAAQIVFCDQSTPTSDGSFSVYNEFRKELVELGIPEQEIAFIHDYETDARKGELFQAVRLGIVRVLLGSTSKLGMGTNVQDRLIAQHDLDLPWRTSDMEQRRGRIVRQGNMFSTVYLYTYLTSASFDAYMAQILHTKAKFIAQVMNGSEEIRTLEDVEGATLSYAEIVAIASGNPLVLEKASVDAELVKVALMRQEWARNQASNERQIQSLPASIEHGYRDIANITADIAASKAIRPDSPVTVGGVARPRENSIGALQRAMLLVSKTEYQAVATVGTFTVLARRCEILGDDCRWKLEAKGARTYRLSEVANASELLEAFSNAVRRFPKDLELAKELVSEMERDLADMKVEVLKPFAHQERYLSLIARQTELATALELTTGDLAAVDETEQSEESAAA